MRKKSSGEHLELKLNSDKLLQKHQMKATMPKVEMTGYLTFQLF